MLKLFLLAIISCIFCSLHGAEVDGEMKNSYLPVLRNTIATTPEGRVHSYISHYHAVSVKAYEMSEAFEKEGKYEEVDTIWNELNRVYQPHFFYGKYSRSSRSIGNHPKHDSSTEKIINKRVSGSTVFIETENNKTNRYFVYRLKEVEGNWLIVNIDSYLGSKEGRKFSREDIGEIIAQTSIDTKLEALPDNIRPNCHKLFEPEAEFEELSEEYIELPKGPTKVESRGTLHLVSGVIGINDSGRPDQNFRPLARRVKPGEYEVEVAMRGRTEIGVRILFDKSSKAVTYKKGLKLDSKRSTASYFVGVDGGNVGLFDAVRFMEADTRHLDELSRRGIRGDLVTLDREEIKEIEANLASQRMRPERLEDEIRRRIDNASYKPATDLKLSEKSTGQDIVYVHTGYGDGSYPIYWGLNEKGEPVSLTVDFMVMAKRHSHIVKIPWKDVKLNEPIRHPDLLAKNISVFYGVDEDEDEDDRALAFVVKGAFRLFEKARLIGAGGRPVYNADTERIGGSSHSSKRAAYYTEDSWKKIRAKYLEIHLRDGYSN